MGIEVSTMSIYMYVYIGVVILDLVYGAFSYYRYKT